MTTITSEEELREEQTEQQENNQQANDQNETKQPGTESDENDAAEDGQTEETDDPDQSDSEGDAGQMSEEDEELNVKYMRLMADFQNFKRRSERERSEIYARANETIVTQLLEVLDNFERALTDENATEDENFRKGMEMIFTQMKDVLSRSGVSEIDAEGQDFDPNFHNAVMMEDTDKVESGKVSEVLQKGYMLNGRVIRASMVKVAN